MDVWHVQAIGWKCRQECSHSEWSDYDTSYKMFCDIVAEKSAYVVMLFRQCGQSEIKLEKIFSCAELGV